MESFDQKLALKRPRPELIDLTMDDDETDEISCGSRKHSSVKIDAVVIDMENIVHSSYQQLGPLSKKPRSSKKLLDTIDLTYLAEQAAMEISPASIASHESHAKKQKETIALKNIPIHLRLSRLGGKLASSKQKPCEDKQSPFKRRNVAPLTGNSVKQYFAPLESKTSHSSNMVIVVSNPVALEAEAMSTSSKGPTSVAAEPPVVVKTEAGLHLCAAKPGHAVSANMVQLKQHALESIFSVQHKGTSESLTFDNEKLPEEAAGSLDKDKGCGCDGNDDLQGCDDFSTDEAADYRISRPLNDSSRSGNSDSPSSFTTKIPNAEASGRQNKTDVATVLEDLLNNSTPIKTGGEYEDAMNPRNRVGSLGMFDDLDEEPELPAPASRKYVNELELSVKRCLNNGYTQNLLDSIETLITGLSFDRLPCVSFLTDFIVKHDNWTYAFEVLRYLYYNCAGSWRRDNAFEMKCSTILNGIIRASDAISNEKDGVVLANYLIVWESYVDLAIDMIFDFCWTDISDYLSYFVKLAKSQWSSKTVSKKIVYELQSKTVPLFVIATCMNAIDRLLGHIDDVDGAENEWMEYFVRPDNYSDVDAAFLMKYFSIGDYLNATLIIGRSRTTFHREYELCDDDIALVIN